MDCITFKVNGAKCSVSREVSSTTTLLDYLRHTLELRGTKFMCLEGGCGACIVSITKCPGGKSQSVNSCLVSVTSCQGWDITTIEQVGNRLKGYHPLQTTLAEKNGTQCGYCTPGWIMAMYALLASKSNLTMLDIERSLSSNICRCTGYRPILEAFKKFAVDAPDKIKLTDIEELCKDTKDICVGSDCEKHEWCLVSKEDLEDCVIHIDLKDGRQWYRVLTVCDLLRILRTKGSDNYMLVAGNTGKGAYPIIEYPQLLIDISGVSQLKGFIYDQNLIVGAGTTLSHFLEILKEASDTEYFSYLKTLYDHIQFVAHVAVRNIGTIAGNLMVKYQHRDFPSDIFLLLVMIGARLTLINLAGTRKIVTLKDFLNEDMKGKVIFNVLMPPYNRGNKFVSYKVAARSRNAHAIVNAGFYYKLDQNNKVMKTRIVFGGLSPDFIRAVKTERYLCDKILFNNDVLQDALKILSDELVVTKNPPEPSVEYRKKLALGLFYKSLISLCPKSILNPRFTSGAVKLHEARPVSTGSQSFTTDPTIWPLNEPVPKEEALIQCAGEVKYTDDIPKLPKEVFCAFVLSTVALGKIECIDATEALQQPGVVAFYTAKDIPGLNSFTSPAVLGFIAYEEILCNGDVKYYNQPIGIIVAESFYIANRATLMVKVTYSDVRKPEIDIKVNKNNPEKSTLFDIIPAQDRGVDVNKVIKGNVTIRGQYHFTFETFMCVSWPTGKGIKVRPTSHFIDLNHYQISRMLNIQQGSIDIDVGQVGGSYGSKLSRQNIVSTSCALVTYKLNRPCRFILPLRSQTRATGKRMPSSTNYEIGVNSDGVIQYLNYDIYIDNGYIVNELIIVLTIDQYYNCYKRDRWNFKCFNTITDNHSNTLFRAPGTLESINSAETIMERIAYELDKDPLEVRLNNLDKILFSDLIEMVDTIKENSNYQERRVAVDNFNIENRWKKRGIRFTLMKWSTVLPYFFNVTLSVFHGDGSVAISHGGVEIGQGINTKVVQVCAYFLNIPTHKIFVKPTNTVLSPNNSSTSSSLTSQNIAIGVRRCCEKILRRLEPLRTQLKNPAWEELVTAAYTLGINLQANAVVDYEDITDFNVYGVTVAEVECDVLTGEWQIIRVDLLEDAGRSVSPKIDIGQVEGAFIMGLGYQTTEELVYDPKTGELKTDRTWNYLVPTGTDIPLDFRIYFRKGSYTSDKTLGAKLISEPPTCMPVVVPFAIREAVTSARSEMGIPSTKWFDFDGPYTVEKICLSCETKIEEFKFY